MARRLSVAVLAVAVALVGAAKPELATEANQRRAEVTSRAGVSG